VEWVVREGVGAGGRNDPSIVCNMNNKKIKKKKKQILLETACFTVSRSCFWL
jgi:hypothetical protein